METVSWYALPWFCQLQSGPRATRIPGAINECVILSITCYQPNPHYSKSDGSVEREKNREWDKRQQKRNVRDRISIQIWFIKMMVFPAANATQSITIITHHTTSYHIHALSSSITRCHSPNTLSHSFMCSASATHLQSQMILILRASFVPLPTQLRHTNWETETKKTNTYHCFSAFLLSPERHARHIVFFSLSFRQFFFFFICCRKEFTHHI